MLPGVRGSAHKDGEQEEARLLPYCRGQSVDVLSAATRSADTMPGINGLIFYATKAVGFLFGGRVNAYTRSPFSKGRLVVRLGCLVPNPIPHPTPREVAANHTPFD